MKVSDRAKDGEFLSSLEKDGIGVTAEKYDMSYGRVYYIVRTCGLEFKALLRGTGNINRSERNEEIMRLRGTGLTLQAIGDTFRLTRERVRQIIERY